MYYSRQVSVVQMLIIDDNKESESHVNNCFMFTMLSSVTLVSSFQQNTKTIHLLTQ